MAKKSKKPTASKPRKTAAKATKRQTTSVIPAGEGAPVTLAEAQALAGARATANAVRRVGAGGAATPAAGPAPQNPQNAERTLEVADYVELPITGDAKSTNLISGQLARGSILRDEPGGRRFFVNDLNGPLYIVNKQTKEFTPYLNFDGAGARAAARGAPEAGAGAAGGYSRCCALICR